MIETGFVALMPGTDPVIGTGYLGINLGW